MRTPRNINNRMLRESKKRARQQQGRYDRADLLSWENSQ